MLGGYTEVEKPTRDTYAFDLKKNAMKMYILASLPEDIGLDFASCTWNNAIYVSGGSQMRNFFAVYKAEDNEWELLPSLPDDGREKHAMAAVNSNIYVLGGLMKTSTGEKTISFNVLQFKTSTKEWSIFCQLPLAVQQSAAAVLSHRIYLFGGINTTGDGTDIVQCVDTLSGSVYQTGKLPSPTYGARALSNGGRIYVVRPEGDVLSMTESFALAERIEELISEVKNQIDDHWSDKVIHHLRNTPHLFFY
ncbi:kelch-like protein 35 [Pomacea canaliculata]|uniref:kelch-like protein 35 n=1 Tax=Pomacea canaliculata TaxID=400727 RepID=UPI000D7359D5|nr:kelch-like protein 35 [Pomacea canaliculata]